MKDLISIAISILALLISCVALYLQFIHRPRRLRVVTMPMRRDGKISFGICNSGKESAYITGLNADYAVQLPNGMTKSHPVGNIYFCDRSAIPPGDILAFSYDLQPPSDFLLSDADGTVNINGEEEKRVDILVSIQVAFPDGTIFSNRFKSGSYIKTKTGSGNEVDGINMDLLKNALPVLKKVERARHQMRGQAR